MDTIKRPCLSDEDAKLLGIYFASLREALHLAHGVPGDLIFCAVFALVLIAPAELRKYFSRTKNVALGPVLQK
jgi:hypothetical protein